MDQTKKKVFSFLQKKKKNVALLLGALKNCWPTLLQCNFLFEMDRIQILKKGCLCLPLISKCQFIQFVEINFVILLYQLTKMNLINLTDLLKFFTNKIDVAISIFIFFSPKGVARLLIFRHHFWRTFLIIKKNLTLF